MTVLRKGQASQPIKKCLLNIKSANISCVSTFMNWFTPSFLYAQKLIEEMFFLFISMFALFTYN